MTANFDFSGRVALVTGGVSGIGAATSKAFLNAGAHVIACGFTEAELAAAKADAELGKAEVVALDVTDKAAVDALIAQQKQLDFVVNSAGIIKRDL
ncbi:MAG: SDR family NAD(P)-dependent oxidoreductase, partial [Burkholderiaceae bacterium]